MYILNFRFEWEDAKPIDEGDNKKQKSELQPQEWHKSTKNRAIQTFTTNFRWFSTTLFRGQRVECECAHYLTKPFGENQHAGHSQETFVH